MSTFTRKVFFSVLALCAISQVMTGRSDAILKGKPPFHLVLSIEFSLIPVLKSLNGQSRPAARSVALQVKVPVPACAASVSMAEC